MELGSCTYCGESVKKYKGKKVIKPQGEFVYHYDCLRLKMEQAEKIIDGGQGFLILSAYTSDGPGRA